LVARKSPSIEREMTLNTALNAHVKLLKEARLRCLRGKFSL